MLYQQGRQQTSPRLSPAHQTAQEDEYLREQFDKLNEVISNMGPRKERFFFRKGGMISTEDGNCEDKRKHCEKFSNQRTMPSNNCSLHEEMGDNFSINHPPKRNKPNVYKSDIDRMEDENGDVKKILTERGDEYLGKFSNSNSNSFCDERSNEELEAEYLRLADQVAEMEINDKRSMEYGKETKQEKFSGPGYRLGTLQSSDEEPDAKERRAEKKQTKIDLIKSEVDSQKSDFEIESMKETPDGHCISTAQKYDHEDDYIFSDKRGNDDLRNRNCDTADRDRPAGSKVEYVAYEKHKGTPYEPEFVKSFECKETQTEMDQETQTVRSLEMQSNADRQRPIYRDIIDVTNITYYEAPSANSELTKHIIVGPVESQSEPAISTTSTIPFQRNSQAADHRTYQQQEYRKYSGREGYPQRMNQGGGMDLDFISAGSDGSDDEKPFETTLYDDSYGRNAGAVTAVLDERRDRGHKVVSRKTNESDLEPKLTLLNTRTSDGQIELNLKSYDGNETFCAYINPDDTIGKVWFLTNLNPDEFEVTADDKVLDLNIPLKNYNIDGDVTLNIVKRKSSIIHTQNKLPVTNETNEEGSIDSQEEDDAPPEISIPDDEEGYSS